MCAWGFQPGVELMNKKETLPELDESKEVGSTGEKGRRKRLMSSQDSEGGISSEFRNGLRDRSQPLNPLSPE